MNIVFLMLFFSKYRRWEFDISKILTFLSYFSEVQSPILKNGDGVKTQISLVSFTLNILSEFYVPWCFLLIFYSIISICFHQNVNIRFGLALILLRISSFFASSEISHSKLDSSGNQRRLKRASEWNLLMWNKQNFRYYRMFPRSKVLFEFFFVRLAHK